MNQHIHCIVNDCHYWQQGNKCVANEILVATDEFGANQADRVDAAMASKLSPAAAGSCMETCCKTYASRGTQDSKVDQVKRMS